MARIQVTARALDMLGRQQMASIPNALHELFKNAFDAYADKAEADFHRSERLLTLWDDGVGMTHEDFLERWLTVGTDSKLRDGSVSPPYRDPRKQPRPVLGEKGIGRLAVATIAPQLLVLTRAERDAGVSGELTVALVNWTFFEVPGLSLDDVDIPVRRIEGFVGFADLPIMEMCSELRARVESLGSRIRSDFRQRLSREIDSFEATLKGTSPGAFDLPPLSGRGTAFVMRPVDPVLEKDIDEEGDDLPPKLLQILRGFSNTMVPGEETPLTVAFRDHGRDGTVRELIGPQEFFTPEDFLAVDHHFEGRFDEYGQFEGTVQVYREKPEKYVLPWEGAGGAPTACGPFEFRLAYLQGNQKESLLEAVEYKSIFDKTNKFGGLYVYRDGIRVLPYGNSDFDFLEIERRRTKSASDWYFSYRRMFGAVVLRQDENCALTEKAGREGFRENRAYRQFKSILVSFFKSLALDWFRDDSVKYGSFHALRDERKRQALLIEKRQKQVKVKREAFASALDAFFEKFESGATRTEASALEDEIVRRLSVIRGLSPDEAGIELLRLEREMRARLEEMRRSCKVVRPRGVGLTKQLLKDLESWERAYGRLEVEIFQPLEKRIAESITATIAETQALVDRRLRVRELVLDRGQRDMAKARSIIKEVKTQAGDLEREAATRARGELMSLDMSFKNTLAEIERSRMAEMDDVDFAEFQADIDARIDDEAREKLDGLERLRDQIQSTLESVREGIGVEESLAVAEERSIALEDLVERYHELAQVGAALGIIQHEFSSTIGGVRKGIRALKPHTAGNPELEKVRRNLHDTFEHLDNYLSMFTPLERRQYRKAFPISGKEIRGYLLEFFDERFKRHSVSVETTNRFLGHSITCFPSTILPAFVNIFDNGLYWMTRDSSGNLLENSEKRVITLDADNAGFIICNSGPGIEERDAKRIFEMSFSRKIRGRGMGLAISQGALRDAGFDIRLVQAGRDVKPCFHIRTIKMDDRIES